MRCHGYLHIEVNYHSCEPLRRSKLSTESCIFNNTKSEFNKCSEDEQKNQRPAFSVLQRGWKKLPEIVLF